MPTFEEVLKERLREAGHPYWNGPPPRRQGPRKRKRKYVYNYDKRPSNKLHLPYRKCFLIAHTPHGTPCKTDVAIEAHMQAHFLRYVATWHSKHGYWPTMARLTKKTFNPHEAQRLRAVLIEQGRLVSGVDWVELTHLGYDTIYRIPLESWLPQDPTARRRIQKLRNQLKMLEELDEDTKEYLRESLKRRILQWKPRSYSASLQRHLADSPSPPSW